MPRLTLPRTQEEEKWLRQLMDHDAQALLAEET